MTTLSASFIRWEPYDLGEGRNIARIIKERPEETISRLVRVCPFLATNDSYVRDFIGLSECSLHRSRRTAAVNTLHTCINDIPIVQVKLEACLEKASKCILHDYTY